MLESQTNDLNWQLEHMPINLAVLHRLRQAILDGSFKPGDRLLQEELAVRFGVSRIPIREALHKLEAEGLVKMRPQRGAIVTELHLDQIEELHEIRAALEGALAEIAVSRIGPVALAQMGALLEQMEAFNPCRDEAQTWVNYNRDFHFALYRSAGRPQFMQLVEKHFLRTMQYITLYLAVPAAVEGANTEHRALCEAVREGDAGRARQVTEQHIMRSGRQLTAVLHARLLEPAPG